MEVRELNGGSENRGGQGTKDSKRMPSESTFYNKIVPIILIVLAIVTILIVLAAVGILLGFLPV
jgi:hypothetical protein